MKPFQNSRNPQTLKHLKGHFGPVLVCWTRFCWQVVRINPGNTKYCWHCSKCSMRDPSIQSDRCWISTLVQNRYFSQFMSNECWFGKGVVWKSDNRPTLNPIIFMYSLWHRMAERNFSKKKVFTKVWLQCKLLEFK